MVQIIDFKMSENAQGKEYVSLKLSGGLEPVQSSQTGRFYITSKTCYIPSTFDAAIASGLIGTKMPGRVVRVDAEPWEYKVKETGELITLTHRYEYRPEEEVITPAVKKPDTVIDFMS